MRPSGLLLLVAVSLSLAIAAPARTRPHYGGTLRVAIGEAPASLDPAESNRLDNSMLPGLSRLIFDTLVTLDARGQAEPALSPSWQADPSYQRWQFSIRRGVAFHDGTAVSSDAVAASLRAANPDWKVFATGESVIIECNAPTPYLAAVLALPRYGIAKRTGGKVVGSGPFAIERWDPGKKLALSARDDYWGGRAFLDSIEIEMGKSFREQMIGFDLGKADLVEVAPDQARHAVAGGPTCGELTSRGMDGAGLHPGCSVRRGWEIARGPGAQHRSRRDEQRSVARAEANPPARSCQAG